MSESFFPKEKPPIADSQREMINNIAAQVTDGLKEKFKPLTKKENAFGLIAVSILFAALMGALFFILDDLKTDVNKLENNFTNLNNAMNDIRIENVHTSSELKIALSDVGYELKDIKSDLQIIKENFSDEKK